MEKGRANDYHAYLLRIWRDGQESPWRTSLVDPHSGEKMSFASLEQMWSFLHGLLQEEGRNGEKGSD
jgi:hypothetical protein